MLKENDDDDDESLDESIVDYVRDNLGNTQYI